MAPSMAYQSGSRQRSTSLVSVLAVGLLAALCCTSTAAAQADEAPPKTDALASYVTTLLGEADALRGSATGGTAKAMNALTAGGPEDIPPVPGNDTSSAPAAVMGRRKLLAIGSRCQIYLINICKSKEDIQVRIGWWDRGNRIPGFTGKGWFSAGVLPLYNLEVLPLNIIDPLYVRAMTTTGSVVLPSPDTKTFAFCTLKDAEYTTYFDTSANKYYGARSDSESFTNSTSCGGIGGYWLGGFWNAPCNKYFVFDKC